MVQAVGSVVNLEHHAFGNSYFEVAACQGKGYPAVRHCWSKRYWPFVVCTEASYLEGVGAAEGCANKAGLDFAALSACYSGADGDAAVVNEAKATVDHPGTPYITVGGEPVNADALLAAVCKAYVGPTPAGCKNIPAVEDTSADKTCPKGEPRCEYLPGKVECCFPGESCIPKVGCRC